MKFLFLIPARGGSKGIPGKNIKLLAGKPLIGYTIEAAIQVAAIEDVCVSTDSEEIIGVAQSFGLSVPFRRPSELSTDEATSESVILHALQFYKDQNRNYDAVVLLQPTSPLRTGRHIREAIAAYHPDIDMVVSVKETKANPYYLLVEEDSDGFLKKSKEGSFKRRQDCPKVYEYNGAIYVINIARLLQTGIGGLSRKIKYVMDEFASVDIDDELDWMIAEACMKRNA